MKLLITGVSGYGGTITLPLLLEDPDIEHIIGIDIKPPSVTHAKLTFVEGDVRNRCLAVGTAVDDLLK